MIHSLEDYKTIGFWVFLIICSFVASCTMLYCCFYFAGLGSRLVGLVFARFVVMLPSISSSSPVSGFTLICATLIRLFLDILLQFPHHI